MHIAVEVSVSGNHNDWTGSINNHMRKFFWALPALLLAGGNACSAQWFTVTSGGAAGSNTTVEIDLETVRIQPGSGESVVRVSYDRDRPSPLGAPYQSFVAPARINCARRAIELVAATFYSRPRGEGTTIGEDLGPDPNLVLEIPAPVRSAIVRAACPTG